MFEVQGLRNKAEEMGIRVQGSGHIMMVENSLWVMSLVRKDRDVFGLPRNS